MKKIVQILFSGLGGHGSVAFSLLPGLTNYKNYFIFYGNTPIIDDYLKKCEENNCDYSFFQTNEKFKLLQFLYKQGPDVIINHNIKISPLLIPLKLFQSTKIISVEHDPINLRNYYSDLSTKISNQFFYKNIVLTKEYLTYYKEKLKLTDASKIAKIENGIDTKRFRPIKNKQFSKPYRLSMISRITTSKDHETLIKAVSILNRENHISDISFCIAGDGDNLTNIKDLAAQLNVEENITFLGLLNEHEVISLLQETDVYLHCSRSETMPTALMQAIAAGLPIISSKIDGNIQLMKKAKGLLYEVNNPKDLANKIYQIINSSSLKNFSIHNRNFAVEELSNKKMIKKYLNIIEE